MDLTDAQWKLIEPLIPENERLIGGWRGRPWRSAREVLNGILWILRTGARWKDLPSRYPSYQTCHRRFQRWVRAGVMERILQALARDLKERGKLDLGEDFYSGRKEATAISKAMEDRTAVFSGDLLYAGNAILRTSLASYTWHVCSSSSNAFYEMSSIQLVYEGDWVVGEKRIKGVDRFGVVRNDYRWTDVHGATKRADVFKAVEDLMKVSVRGEDGPEGKIRWRQV